jgi:hypothetical protein
MARTLANISERFKACYVCGDRRHPEATTSAIEGLLCLSSPGR